MNSIQRVAIFKHSDLHARYSSQHDDTNIVSSDNEKFNTKIYIYIYYIFIYI